MRQVVLLPVVVLAIAVVLIGCSDSTSPNGDGDSGLPVDVHGRWTGTWDSSVYELDGNFTVNLMQDGTVLYGSIDIPDIGMSGAEVSGTVAGNHMTFGDIQEQITFVGTVAQDSTSASGTYDYPSTGDNGSWQATKGTGNYVTLLDSLEVPAFLSGDITFDGADFRLLGTGDVIYTVDPTVGVVDSMTTPGSYPDGIAFDGEFLLVGDGPIGTHRIFKVDPVHTSVHLSPGSGAITGLAHDGASLWCANDHYATPKIYRINADGDLVDSLNCMGSSVRGLAYDGSHLWYTAFDNGETKIYQIDLSGTVQSSFEAPSFLAAGLTFDGTHLWYADWSEDKMYQLDTVGNVLSSFDSPGESPADLAFDGTYLWHADGDISSASNRIYQMDTSGNVVSSIDCPGYSPGGLAFDSTYLWHADKQSHRIYRLNASGDNWWDYPPFDILYLASDGSCLWSCEYMDSTVYRFDYSGNVVASFACPCLDIGGLVWDGTSLWVAASGMINLEKLIRLNSGGQVLATYGPFAQLPAPCGLAFDGTDLWYVGRAPFEMSFKLYRLSLG